MTPSERMDALDKAVKDIQSAIDDLRRDINKLFVETRECIHAQKKVEANRPTEPKKRGFRLW